jgi:hypothetical protein
MKRHAWILCPLLFLTGCGFEDRVPIEMTSISQTQPFGNEKALTSTVRFDIGSLEITGNQKSSLLYSLDLEYDKASYKPDINYTQGLDGAEGRLSFDLHSMHKRGIRRERHNNRLRLAFNDSVPLNLQVHAGVGDARLSFSGMKLARLEFESGVGGAKMSAYEPNSVQCESVRLKNGVGGFDATGLGNLNFREFEFEGGVGGANLDFTGEWKQNADIKIKVGVGGVNMVMPRDVGVRVEAEKNFLSGLHLEGFTQRDTYHYSENYDSAPVRVSVRVETGIGGLRITWS